MKYYSKEELINDLNNKTLSEYVYLPAEGLVSVSADICAIMNYRGGVLIFGIDPSLNVVGINDTDKYIKYLKNRINQIHPKPETTYTTYIINKKNIVLMEIDELKLEEKLAHVHHNQYIMRENKVREMSTYVERSYYAFIKGEDIENLRESHINSKLLDLDLLEVFMNKAKAITNNKYSNFQIMILYKIHNGTRYPTYCKELCFGLYPQLLHPNADVLIYDHRPKEKLVRRITGNIYFMVKDTLIFLREYLGMSLYINEKKEVVRKEAYPIVVLKEAIYNSLIHREYNKIVNLWSNEIHIYDSKIEILNPGCFIYEGSMKDNRIKMPRNPGMKRINDLLLETPLNERGISSIFSYMKKYGYVEPTITNYKGVFKVTLYNKTVYDFYNEKISVKKICDFCSEPKSKKEIYNQFYPNGKSTPYYFISKYIFPLINNGVLKLTDEKHKKSKNQKIVLNIFNEN